MKSVLVSLLVAAAAYGADPRLVGLLMPDAKVVAGLQLADSQRLPFGQFLLKQIPADSGLDGFVTSTGFDPRADLAEIAAASTGDNRWLIAGRGMFPSSRIAGLAQAAGATVTQYGGVDLIAGPVDAATGIRPKGASAGAERGIRGMAFLDPSTVLLGDMSLIKSAIDRRASGAVFSGPLAIKAQQVSGKNQVWLATLSSLSEALPALSGMAGAASPQANFLQSVTGLALGLRLGAADVTLNGEALTRSEKDAQALVDILHFVVSMAQANRAAPDGAGAATLADAASITAKGSSMLLTLIVPEQQLEQLLASQGSAQGGAKAPIRPKRTAPQNNPQLQQ
jgi:hypothetical protein